MDGLSEPVGQPLLTVLRRAVVDHGAAERRRVYPPLLHVGWPGVRAQVFAAEPGDRFDQTLRCDVVAALLRSARLRPPTAGAVPMLWLTRSGTLEVGDLDLAWLSAALRASAEAGLGLTFVIVTKRGWCDPRTGCQREWRRVRAS
jgi:hypothetical protein